MRLIIKSQVPFHSVMSLHVMSLRIKYPMKCHENDDVSVCLPDCANSKFDLTDFFFLTDNNAIGILGYSFSLLLLYFYSDLILS